jgi:hypothetical protein
MQVTFYAGINRLHEKWRVNLSLASVASIATPNFFIELSEG